MPSAIHHLSLKQKLILFSLLPLLMTAILVLSQMYFLFMEYHNASRNHFAIQATTEINNALHQLNNEYQLSVAPQYSGSPQSLLLAQQNTSAALDKLLSSSALSALIDTDWQLKSGFKTHYQALKYKVQQLNEDSRNKSPSNSTLESYGQLSLQLLQLVELFQRQTTDIQQARSYTEVINLLKNHEFKQNNDNGTDYFLAPNEFSLPELEQLHTQVNAITTDMAHLSHNNQQRALRLLGLYLGLITLTTLVTLWLGHKIVRSFLDKISVIAKDMQRMAKDPSLNIYTQVPGSDELALMAQSLNRMIAERKRSNHALSLAATVFEYSSEGIMVTDANNRIKLVNRAFCQITGYSAEEVTGGSPSMLSSERHPPHFYTAMWDALQQRGSWEGEIWNKRKNGQVYPEYLAITVVRNPEGEIIQYIGLFRDISNRKQNEQKIWYQTNFDSLTGLPNRKLFNERLQHDIQNAQHEGCKLAVMQIDLDQFKYINDVQGHACGDQLLQQVARRLERLTDKQQFVARIGGDGFVMILPRITNELAIEHMANRICEALALPFELSQQQLHISASFGIGVYPEDGADVSTLSRNTEMAMYQAKGAGRNNFKYFTSGMNQRMHSRMQLEQRLRRAVVHNEFSLHYQPIVDMQTGEVNSVEALIRWQDPEFGMIPPEQFISIAEETGLIEPMGEWVLNQAMADLKEWQQSGLLLNLALNVSSRQCVNSRGIGFEQILAECFNRHKINPKNIHIEITESMLMGDATQGLSTLKAIRKLGSEIYMDDFGTGYSSLSYLKQFPISVIKIDRSFVENVLEDNSSANLVKAIVMMGQSLEMKLVAEGIETEAQWHFLQALGCHYGQGYWISKPLPFDELSELLHSKGSLLKVDTQLVACANS
ncbi:putative bifunctional diguanylate cyclase/phosphodiesterase [Shewanella acanthi]|uniref:putative bifunctional diguanylate cyclase/phosphodiesterase n=1 Tax=Shewanella acanthi TaxID=2864212 RepID=UPI001C656B9F|nr:EAL domain-containing protein [Shewanella acanthi]QYJ78969.1 EAL domain-containing protein [Shewanella acanthi]